MIIHHCDSKGRNSKDDKNDIIVQSMREIFTEFLKSELKILLNEECKAFRLGWDSFWKNSVIPFAKMCWVLSQSCDLNELEINVNSFL